MSLLKLLKFKIFLFCLICIDCQQANNVRTTFHGASENGACSLPAETYSSSYPLALGDIPSLGGLRFTPDLCGHVLRVNCGRGALNVIVTNSNLGNGLDLYTSAWRRATNSMSPGITSCSVQMTSHSLFRRSGYVCYHATGETNNPYYRNVGLLNVRNKLVVRATYNGMNGAHRGNNPYYAFDGFGREDQRVRFYFSDGTSHSVLLRDCRSGEKKQMWS